MGRLHSWRGSPRAMLLAGFVLSCIMQAVPAQDNPYLVAKPPIPFVSGSVVLSVQRLPRSFIWCQWHRRTQSVTGEILTYDPQESTKQVNSNAYTGRETVWQNCSLHISQLTQRDTGNYSVEIGVPSQTQQGTQEERPDFIEAVFYLQVSALDQTSMKILPRPQNPEPGQDVVLAPQGNPKTFTFCQWSKQTHSGRSEYILSNYFTQQKAPEQERGSAYSGRETLQQDCSLRLGRLTTADTGNYTVELAGPGYWPDQSGQKPNSLKPGDVRVYRAHTYLKIGQQTTGTKPRLSSSASLSYSAAILAGALLGSLAWAETLMALLSMLFGSFASSRPKRLL